MNRRDMALGVMGALALANGADGQNDALAGDWTGQLPNGGAEIILRLRIARGRVDLVNLAKPRESIAVRIDALAPDDIRLRFPSISARYAGRMISADRLEGVFEQSGTLSVATAFARGAAPAPLMARPAPRPLTLDDLEALRLNRGLPALAASAQRAGGMAREWHTGFRALGSEVKIEADDLWHLGSITKSMTATLVARLVEAGMVSWDDRLGDGLKTIAPDMRPDYADVTYRHLLSHRSGLMRDPPLIMALLLPRSGHDVMADRRGLTRAILRQPPVGSKEKTFNYSNVGYVTAATMLETRLGASWEELIRRHLFEPLALKTAGFGPPGGRAPFDQPYGHQGRKPVAPTSSDADNVPASGPAGRVHMTLSDLLVFLAAHRDQSSLLGVASWKTLHTPPFGGAYALGWQIGANGKLHHGCSNALWLAEVEIDPVRKTVAAAVCNRGEDAPVADIAARSSAAV